MPRSPTSVAGSGPGETFSCRTRRSPRTTPKARVVASSALGTSEIAYSDRDRQRRTGCREHRVREGRLDAFGSVIGPPRDVSTGEAQPTTSACRIPAVGAFLRVRVACSAIDPVGWAAPATWRAVVIHFLADLLRQRWIRRDPPPRLAGSRSHRSDTDRKLSVHPVRTRRGGRAAPGCEGSIRSRRSRSTSGAPERWGSPGCDVGAVEAGTTVPVSTPGPAVKLRTPKSTESPTMPAPSRPEARPRRRSARQDRRPHGARGGRPQNLRGNQRHR